MPENSPSQKPKLPPSIPYIVGNEAAERFSFYGMKAILMTYMTGTLLISKEMASVYGHLFNVGVYLLPILGAVLADCFWGKYKTVIRLSVVYCFGHLVLALPAELWGGKLHIPLFLGMALIALGSGGIKSCISAIVGDQFTAENQSLMEKVYGWFYLSINIGAAVSMTLTPWLLKKYGPEVAFGVPGIFMLLATIIFYCGRKKYILVPPSGKNMFRDLTSRAGLTAVLKVSLVFVFLIVGWAIYEQNGYRWVAQAENMNPMIFAGISGLPEWTRNIHISAAQMQAVNPVLILILVPLFSRVVYPFINRFYRLTLIRKIACGLWLMALSALLPLWFERNILSGVELNIAWQMPAYVILTTAEIMVYVTSLELAYTQAPPSMKSLIMGMFLMTFALGNLLTAVINGLCEKHPEFLAGEAYYRFFFILGIVNAAIFLIVAAFYREKTYLQEEGETFS